MLKELKSSADSHHEYVMTCEDKAVVLYIFMSCVLYRGDRSKDNNCSVIPSFVFCNMRICSYKLSVAILQMHWTGARNFRFPFTLNI